MISKIFLHYAASGADVVRFLSQLVAFRDIMARVVRVQLHVSRGDQTQSAPRARHGSWHTLLLGGWAAVQLFENQRGGDVGGLIPLLSKQSFPSPIKLESRASNCKTETDWILDYSTKTVRWLEPTGFRALIRARLSCAVVECVSPLVLTLSHTIA